MGVRLFGLATLSALVMAVFMVAGNGGPASAQDATPAATPVPETSGVVTLVGWYSRDESGNFLTIGPLQSNENLVSRAAQPTDHTITGKINFDSEENNDMPRISIGSSVLHAYPVVEGDPSSVQRYIYFDDDPNVRPFTLVMQVEGVAGPYDGYIGTVTLVSRSEDGSGVIVVVLNPPS